MKASAGMTDLHSERPTIDGLLSSWYSRLNKDVEEARFRCPAGMGSLDLSPLPTRDSDLGGLGDLRGLS